MTYEGFGNSEGVEDTSPWYEAVELQPTLERITGTNLAEEISHNFYMEAGSGDTAEERKAPFQPLGIAIPKSMTAIELTGLPASGKHSIEKALIERIDPDEFLTRQAARAMQVPREFMHVKETMRRPNVVEGMSGKEVAMEMERTRRMQQEPFSDDNLFLSKLLLFSELKGASESHAKWFVTTMGPLAVFELALHNQPGNREKIRGFLGSEIAHDYNLVKGLDSTKPLQQVAEDMPQELYLAGMDTVGEVVMDVIGIEHFTPDVRKHTWPTKIPVVNGPTLLTFISSRSPREVVESFEAPSTLRTSPRPYGKDFWKYEDLLTMRLVHALMIKTDPRAFIEINAESSSTFAQDCADTIVEVAKERLG